MSRRCVDCILRFKSLTPPIDSFLSIKRPSLPRYYPPDELPIAPAGLSRLRQRYPHRKRCAAAAAWGTRVDPNRHHRRRGEGGEFGGRAGLIPQTYTHWDNGWTRTCVLGAVGISHHGLRQRNLYWAGGFGTPGRR